MASTLVEIQTATPVVLEQYMHVITDRPAGSHRDSHEISVEEKPTFVTQLSLLASQHHASEYNRLKFGPKGSPLTYVPFSIQMPDQVQQLREHQARCAERQAWWPCDKNSSSVDPASSESCLPHSLTNLQQELSAAMSVSLNMTPPTSYTKPVTLELKTSETHPINVSAMIPFELLRIITSHLVQASPCSPVIFELPPSFFLDRVTAEPSQLSSEIVARGFPVSSSPAGSRSVAASPCSPTHSLARPVKLAHLLWTNPTIRRALHTATGGGIPVSHTKRSRPKSIVSSELSGSIILTLPDPLPKNIVVEHPYVRNGSSSPCVDYEKSVDGDPPRPQSAPPAVDKTAKFSVVRTFTTQASGTGGSQSVALSKTRPITSAVKTRSSVPPQVPPISHSATLGNLYLSSCPGKKVRLSGPVKGRGGVCRDLRQDLHRMKELGVACIVCCLDDDELQFLGVSWAEYLQLADELRLDILRIPTPEGLAPADLRDFDSQLTRLIQSYTLLGAPVLVHCRGGVGRAGLVACCWLLKLGLCGWIETEPHQSFTLVTPGNLPDTISSNASAHAKSSTDDGSPIRRDTMQLVERVIAVVRRRRSPKAVETYEQVKFLVDFVELLRTRSTNAVVSAHLVQDWDTQID
ncbi:hypothetical protein AcW1_003806 [Taiwanofungus camphoratus]|nr:hypothetical protein AcW1_003806 [Antrodia cinnamomea]